MRPGDWVIIELGHNDNGPYDSGRAGAESKVFLMEKTGKHQVICTFGWCLRKFIMDVKEKRSYTYRIESYSTQ